MRCFDYRRRYFYMKFHVSCKNVYIFSFTLVWDGLERKSSSSV